MKKVSSFLFLVPALLFALVTGCGKKETPVPGPGGEKAGAPVEKAAGPAAPTVPVKLPNVKENVEIDGMQVEVEHSAFDNGRLVDLFDKSKETLARTANDVTMLLDLHFASPRKMSGVEVTTGTMDVGLKVTLTVQGKSEPVSFKQDFTKLGLDPTMTIDFGGSFDVKQAKIEVTNLTGGDGHVHVREVKFK